MAAFGKHPGWNDFMDDLGIETPQLADFRQLVIEKGIKGCVEGGRWANLEPDKTLESYSVSFLYRNAGDLIIGRMWSSKDGKGRPFYPMVLCVQTRSITVDDALAIILPALDAAQERCRAATTAADVGSAVNQLRESLRARAASLESARTDLRISGEAATEIAAQLNAAGGPPAQAFHRVMYQMDRELVPFLRGQTVTRSRGPDPISRQIRVPACWPDSLHVLSRWTPFLFLRIEPWPAVMLMHPEAGNWLDIAVGELSGPELFCIRASTRLIPLATDIPYTIEPGDAAKFDRFLSEAPALAVESVRTPVQQATAVAGAGREAVAAYAHGLNRKVLILAIVLGLLLILSLGWLLFGPSSAPKPSPSGGTGSAEGARDAARSEPAAASLPAQAPVAEPRVQQVAAPAQAAPSDDPTWDPAPWQRICTAYWDWLELLMRRLDERPHKALFGDQFATRRELYAQHPALAPAVAAMDLARAARQDPWAIAGLTADRDLSVLANKAPPSARTAAARTATLESARTVDQIEAALVRGWADPDDLVRTSQRMRTHQWAAGAEFLARVGEAARPGGVAGGGGRDLALGIDAVLAVRDTAASVDRRMAAIDSAVGAIESDAAARADRIIGRFGDWCRTACVRDGAVGGASASAGAALTIAAVVAGLAELNAINTQIARPAEIAADVSAFLKRQWEETDREQFKLSGPVYASAADTVAATDGAVFRDWLYQAGQYRSLDASLDPRRQDQFAALSTRISASLAALAEPATAAAGAAKSSPALANEAAGLADASRRLALLAWNRKNEAEITASTRELSVAAEALALRVERTLQDARAELGATAAASRDELKSRNQIVAGPPSGAINTFWRDQRDRLLAGYDAARFKEMMAHAGRIEDALVALDKQAPASLTVDAGAEVGSAGAAVLAEFAKRRERRLEQSLAPLKTSLIEPDDQTLRDSLTQAASDVAALASRFTVFAVTTSMVESLLNTGCGSPITPVAGPWAADPLMSDPAVRQAVAPTLARVQAVGEIERETEPRALAERLTPKPGAERTPELLIAAWRRIGSLPGAIWPLSAEDLAAESRAVEQLRAIASAAPPERAAALRAEIAAEHPRRLKRMLAAADRDEQFRAAREQLAGAGLKIDDLDPPIRFNLMLEELKHSVRGSGAASDDQAAGAARSFIDGAHQLPGGAAFRGDAAAAIQRVEEALAGRSSAPPPVDPATLGPASTGKYTGKADGAVLTFTPTGGGQPLAFVRVEAEGGLAPFYLGVDEVSLAALISMTRAAGSPIAAVLAKIDQGEDVRPGPRTWEWDARGTTVQPARQWLLGDSPDQYAPPQAGGGTPGRPSSDHPVQYISPQAAVAAARLAGCRLPTPAEFRRADALFAAKLDPARCNLRDQTWARHHAYVDKAIAQGRNIQPADAGAFATAANAPASASDDGALWFVPVNSGGGDSVHHLRGNVAEWLAESPNQGGDSVERLAFFIGGASAISDVSPEPRPVKTEDAMDGFADVGFRLAFSATGTGPTRKTLAEQIDSALTPTPYLRSR